MGAPKRGDKTMDVGSIRDALPSARRSFRRPARKPSSQQMPAALPECFSEVWRRRHSKHPADRQQRASLEAVASTIPRDASSLTGQPAAAVYLASLVLALQRLIETSKPVQNNGSSVGYKPLSKKERKKQRRKDREAEDEVRKMAVGEVLGTKNNNQSEITPMNLDHDDGGAGDASKKGGADGDVDLIASLVSLIAFAVRGTSAAVVNAKCESILQIVMGSYDHVSGHVSVSRHISTVLAGVLAALEPSAWAKPIIQRAYLYLLRSTSEQDPKSRRKAREALDALPKSSRGSTIGARSSSAASSHYISELRLLSGALHESLHGDTVAEEKMNPVCLIHLLTSIDRFAVYLNPGDAAVLAKELLVISMKNLPSISSFAFTALSSIFKHRTGVNGGTGLQNDQKVFLPQGDLEKLLRAALRHDVGTDFPIETVVSYISCIANGAVSYAHSFAFSSPPKEFIVEPVRKVLGTIDSRLGPTEVSKNAALELKSLLSQHWFKSRPEILGELHSLTEPPYRPVWPDMIPVLRRYLEQDMSAGKPSMQKSVKKIASAGVSMYQKSAESSDFRGKKIAVEIISSVVRGGGCSSLLSVCEVRFDSNLHVTNAWVLPILKDSLSGAQLSLFMSKLLPVADKLEEAMKKTANEERLVESKNLSIYFAQIWGLLPGFCTKPSDLGEERFFNMAFKAIHTCFEATDTVALYPTAVRSLSQLALSVSSLDYEEPHSKKKVDSFGNRMKKLFPTLAVVAERTADDRRAQLLSAITKSCIATRNPTLVSHFLRKCIRRLLELQIQRLEQTKEGMDIVGGSDVVQCQHAAADTAIAIAESKIIPKDATETDFLEKAMSPFFLDGRESSLQKKAYRATALLIGEEATVKSNNELDTFCRIIAEARKNVAAGAKAARLGLIIALVNRHDKINARNEKEKLLQLLCDQFLSEVILGTRDASEKTRVAAFDTLVAMARGWNMITQGADMSGLQRFFIMVAAGLGGKTVPMLSATLTSLGRLIFDFRGEASGNEELARVVDSLFASKVSTDRMDTQKPEDSAHSGGHEEVLMQAGPIAILLRHSAYEVQKSALGVIKIATKALASPADRLVNVLPGILPGLVHVSARSRKQETRLKVRVILERLLRRCGRDVLEANFPQEHLKLLAAVRKQHSRDLIKKHAKKEKRKSAIASRDEEVSEDEDAMGGDMGEGIGIDDSDSDVEREIVDGDELLLKSKRNRHEELDGPLRVRESKDQVLDLLDAKNSQSVLTAGDVKEASLAARLEQKRTRRKENLIKYTEDGRPIFVESDDESGKAQVGSAEEGGDSEDSEDERNQKRSGSGSGQKRKRHEPVDGDRHTKKVRGSFGEEYRSRRGAGDVKRSGRPDPYAYIPLGAGMTSAKSAFNSNKSRRDAKPGSGTGRRGKKLSGIVPGRR
eukprot:GFKZ01004117.1.p1 GENE.GFKZ01004117.1~~GFKZ01004117.1.p1  ORF type:complete len:1411 (-),score=216.63 GFKZ01004117.1:511-4743(-)